MGPGDMELEAHLWYDKLVNGGRYITIMFKVFVDNENIMIKTDFIYIVLLN